jgi:hypothetical protein
MEKSNLIKAVDLQPAAPAPRMITIQIPVVDTFHTAEQKIEKMKEEIDEILDEFCKVPVNSADAVSEAYDVMQVMTGYILARFREMLPPKMAYTATEDYFAIANKKHLLKIEGYAEERGWMVVS